MLEVYLSLIDNDNEKRRFEEIYNTYKKQMGLMAKTILKNRQDAEDIVHDVFYSIASSHMDVIIFAKSEDDVRNYLLKSVKNASISFLRKQKVRVKFQEEQKETQRAKISDREFLDIICNGFEAKEFICALESMDNKYREVLYYKLVLELSTSEISKLVGRPVNTVRQQIARGKKILVDMVMQEGSV